MINAETRTATAATAATPAETERALKLWVVLNRAQQAVEHHDRDHIVSRGISPGEFAVVEALYHKGRMLLGEIRQSVLVSSGGVTYLVDKLVDRGLVERVACPEDRRAMYAALTPAGSAWIEEVFPEHARRLARALGGLDADEQDEAIRLLKKLGLAAEELPLEGRAEEPAR